MKRQKQLIILDHCIACSTCNNVAPTVFGGKCSPLLLTTGPLSKKSMEALKVAHPIGTK